MRDRLESILKIVCAGLLALVLVRLVVAGIHFNPLAGVTIPAVPTLPADTNALAAATNKAPRSTGTNAAKAAGSNAAPQISAEANAIAGHETGTNMVAAAEISTASDTNSVAARPKKKRAATVPNVASDSVVIEGEMKAPAAELSDTNIVAIKAAAGTNLIAGAMPGGTNGASPRARGKRPPTAGGSPEMMAMMTMRGGPGAKKLPELPPAIQARVNRVVESEILGPVPHPMPMALLGIAGNYAFLRSASGQTGMIKEGDSVGELKLVRIGINRVLVEQDGDRKELMIFSGYGGESLLPKTTETQNENSRN